MSNGADKLKEGVKTNMRQVILNSNKKVKSRSEEFYIFISRVFSGTYLEFIKLHSVAELSTVLIAYPQ